MHYLIGAAFGLLFGSGATLYFDKKIVNAARSAEIAAKLTLQRARQEYANLKAGLAHKLDDILK